MPPSTHLSCPAHYTMLRKLQLTRKYNQDVSFVPLQKRQEDRTVFVLHCDGRYALEKRPNKGLLAGLWQFPNVSGHLELEAALEQLRKMGLQPKALYREVHRKHIFTHIIWNMKGIYLEVTEGEPGFQWFTEEEIETQAALPTAFRQFWEDTDNV